MESPTSSIETTACSPLRKRRARAISRSSAVYGQPFCPEGAQRNVIPSSETHCFASVLALFLQGLASDRRLARARWRGGRPLALSDALRAEGDAEPDRAPAADCLSREQSRRRRATSYALGTA